LLLPARFRAFTSGPGPGWRPRSCANLWRSAECRWPRAHICGRKGVYPAGSARHWAPGKTPRRAAGAGPWPIFWPGLEACSHCFSWPGRAGNGLRCTACRSNHGSPRVAGRQPVVRGASRGLQPGPIGIADQGRARRMAQQPVQRDAQAAEIVALADHERCTFVVGPGFESAVHVAGNDDDGQVGP